VAFFDTNKKIELNFYNLLKYKNQKKNEGKNHFIISIVLEQIFSYKWIMSPFLITPLSTAFTKIPRSSLSNLGSLESILERPIQRVQF